MATVKNYVGTALYLAAVSVVLLFALPVLALIVVGEDEKEI